MLATGCGSDEPTTEATPGPTAKAEIVADGSEDRQIGLDLRNYLLFNCPQPGWDKGRITEKFRDSPFFRQWKHWARGAEAMCASIATIEVDDSRVVVRTGLANDALGRAAAAAFCNLIQGSDVADFTPGHELQDIDGAPITVCPARTD